MSLYYQQQIQYLCDQRLATLAKIKARSLGADKVILTAFEAFVYAQLEGGVKDLSACSIREINRYKLTYGTISPNLLKWRNNNDLNAFRSIVDVNMIASPSPFSSLLSRRVSIHSINRRYELNQMSWAALSGIYTGLGLSLGNINGFQTQIDEILDGRNQAAHYGVSRSLATNLFEKHVRQNIDIVENVIIDFSIQLMTLFSDRLHLR